MSVKRSFQIICDGCGYPAPLTELTAKKPVRLERKRLSALHWTRDPKLRGKDYCRKCS